MKKNHLFVLSLITLCSLVGCNKENTSTSSTTYASVDGTIYNSSIVVEEKEEISVEENTGDFSLTTSDGNFSTENNIYTISTAGTYSLSGKLEGQILIEAPEEDDVVSLSYSPGSAGSILESKALSLFNPIFQ